MNKVMLLSSLIFLISFQESKGQRISQNQFGCYFTQKVSTHDGSLTIAESVLGTFEAYVETGNAHCGVDGFLKMGAQGGIAPYFFYVNGSQVFKTEIYNLKAGNYLVKISDAIGNFFEITAVIENVGGTGVTFAVDYEDTHCGIDSGSAKVIIASGTAPFTYNWSNGANTKSIDGLKAGKYFVTVTDAGGCSATGVATIASSEAVVIAVDYINSICGQSNGSAIATADKGVFPYSFKWSTGDSTEKISKLKAGKYSVTVTDKVGCTASKAFTIENIANSDTLYLKVKTFCASDTVKTKKDSVLTLNSQGCHTLTVTIREYKKADTIRLERTSCIVMNPDTVHQQNKAGCDTAIVITNFLYKLADTTILKDTTCAIRDSGIHFIAKLQNQFLCDSFVFLHSTYIRSIIFGYRDSLTCDENQIGRTYTSSSIWQSSKGCDSMLVFTFVSNIDTVTIHRSACTFKPETFNRIKCDSVVRIITDVVPQADTTFSERMSCVRTGTEIVHHKYTGLNCDSLVEYITYSPVRIDTVLNSSKTCDANLARPRFLERLVKDADSCIIKVFLKEVLFVGVVPTTQTIIRDTCDPNGKNSSRTYTIKTVDGCDAVYVTEITRVHKPYILKLTERVCTPSEARMDTLVSDFTSFGCDSLVIQEYVYTKPMNRNLKDTTICGVKNEFRMEEKHFTFQGSTCDSLVTFQKVTENETPRIMDQDFANPTINGGGSARFFVEGGVAPYKWQWSGGVKSTQSNANNIFGGDYFVIVSDTKGCRDTGRVKIAEIWLYSNGTGSFNLKGGYADQTLLDFYGSEIGTYQAFQECGKAIPNTSGNIDMSSNFDIAFHGVPSGVVLMRIDFPNVTIWKKVTVH